MYFPDSTYEDIQDNFIQDSAEIIEDIFGENISESQKEELLNSIVFILERNARKYLNNVRNPNLPNNFISFPNNLSNSNNSIPSLNLIIGNPGINLPNYAPSPLQFMNPPSPNPYFYNTIPNPISIPQSVQPFQQPNFPFYNQPFQLPYHNFTNPKSHKNSKIHTNKHHHKKSSKKSKKDKKSKSTKSEKYKEVGKFELKDPKSLTGVINYLKSLGNIENMIGISSSSTECQSSYQPKDALTSLHGNIYFKSKNESNSWLCLDFREFRVCPTNYTIGSSNNGYKLKSWVFEGSIDNIEWVTLDTQNDSNLMKNNNTIFAFPAPKSEKMKFRYLRIRMTGPNWAGNNHMRFNSFEIYGKLYK